MALIPTDDKHKSQILAGTLGRLRGHNFEKYLTSAINEIDWSKHAPSAPTSGLHLFVGAPATHLLSYILVALNIDPMDIVKVEAWWLGGLATLKEGDIVRDEGIIVAKSKSDVLIKIFTKKAELTVGVSVKSCDKKSPTNDQIYFTTATGFSNLLRLNSIAASEDFETGMKMFCGDKGFRPLDNFTKEELAKRIADPNRYYLEELPEVNRRAIEETFSTFQENITRVLLQKAYPNDPYEPEFVIHQTHKYETYDDLESSIMSINELIAYSNKASGFTAKDYVIRKGTYKADNSVHKAPRFGFIQFQRGGQKQHPTQLQFNLQAGYFYKI